MRIGVGKGAEQNVHKRDTQSCGELFSSVLYRKALIISFSIRKGFVVILDADWLDFATLIRIF